MTKIVWTLEEIAAEQSDFKRKMMFLAWLTVKMQDKGINFTVVGGEAAELYTFGKYESAAIDIVSSGSISLRETLREIGFKNQGKDWWSDSLRIFLEIVSSSFTGDETRVKGMDLGRGISVRVIGIEDLILDRLASCEFWKFKADCEIAIDLLARYRTEIDMDYLTVKAKTDKVSSKLQELLEFVDKDQDENNSLRPR